ncbi:hypothetical protein C4561_01490 [candidate division WWE3 bacterium]|uniref:Uncharacterized protein n=1 Tax=candidate division WWE3 bacterium TaxID=2053526 RepID=A0A3A4ZMJ2_UNCKA|nr:MAG: hypothetical protein C4561_01490 [candidate division WWE3 bacterium]
MRPGLKTTEGIVGLVTCVVAAVLKGLGIVDFPTEAFAALVAWVVGRSLQKTFGMTAEEEATAKRAWKSSEFWATILYAGAKFVWPSLPDEVLAMVLTWISVRTGVKITPNWKIGLKKIGTTNNVSTHGGS